MIFLHVFPVDGVVSSPAQETGMGEIAEDTDDSALALLTGLVLDFIDNFGRIDEHDIYFDVPARAED